MRTSQYFDRRFGISWEIAMHGDLGWFSDRLGYRKFRGKAENPQNMEKKWQKWPKRDYGSWRLAMAHWCDWCSRDHGREEKSTPTCTLSSIHSIIVLISDFLDTFSNLLFLSNYWFEGEWTVAAAAASSRESATEDRVRLWMKSCAVGTFRLQGRARMARIFFTLKRKIKSRIMFCGWSYQENRELVSFSSFIDWKLSMLSVRKHPWTFESSLNLISTKLSYK